MSITIDWATLTTGPSGLALADSIRDFIHDKFQQVTLPRFIRSVYVHSFDFGEECPVVELKDITDPLPEFYEDDEDEDEKPSSEDGEGEEGEEAVSGAIEDSPSAPRRQPNQPPYRPSKSAPPTTMKPPPPPPHPPLPANNTRLPNLHLRTPGLPFPPPPDQISTPFLSRSTTPGGGIPIPGGTSNFTSYFHLPLSNSAGLSGTQTPLLPWGEQYQQRPPSPLLRREQQQGQGHSPFFSTYADIPGAFRPTTGGRGEGGGGVDSHNPPHHLNHRQEPPTTTPKKAPPPPPPPPPPPRTEDDHSQDLQTTLHISYSGSLSLSLTAEILLDYPMPSFVGIPLKLQITGLSFDGVALLAYLRHHHRGRAQADGGGGGGGAEEEEEEAERRRVHFCFLGREDARAMVGDGHGHGHGREDDEGAEGRGSENKSGEEREEEEGLGGLLREIRVESEIGRQENGKQVLKNVGKVEKFVLEQVRRIFEDEFVWPSFWTFLV